MSVALVCKRCAAPLPTPGGGSPFVGCSFCGTTHTVSAPAISMAPQARPPTQGDLVRAAADRAWDEARAKCTDPVVALRAVIAARSGELQTELEAERAARLGEALLTGFDAEHKTQSISDKNAALRIAEATVKAVIELRKMAETEINLPFFMANADGPKHLCHQLTPAKLAALDAMGAFVVKEVAPPVAAPEPKKKGWWPFR